MRFMLVVLAMCCAITTVADDQQSPSLMPLPAHLQVNPGRVIIDPSFSVSISGTTDPRLRRGVERFLDDLRRQTGMLPLDMKIAEGDAATLVIHTDKPSKEIPQLDEDESYTLEITASGAKLNSASTRGALHGLQTFLQLVENTSAGFAVPAASIQDAPRFPWRGLMIDCARHFMPLEVIKRNLDGMAAVKLNVFHWHLSDNQGFRVESKKFPKLQEKGSDGFYYTQAEVRDIIAYAADRGIRVIPEFDMPGHSTAWFVGYPQLASGPGPYQIERRWGVFDPAMDPTRDDSYKFLESFIAEMAKLFPDQYFHIGGDEVNGKEWGANPKIQAFMHSHDIKNNAELQAYFNKRVEKIVSKNHKTMLGWDEILQPDIPKSIVIQSWRGQASLAQAARQGIPGILSAGYYLDLMYPTSQHYAVDPLGDAAASLTPEQQKLVLGGEACEWSEFASPEIIDSRIWPRNAAIAERLWSPQNITDMASMYARMYQESERLDWLGLTHNSNYQPMLRRIADAADLTPLQTLADVVEPVKAYAREGLVTTPPTSQTPLNRLIDAARPESETARRFALMVDDFLANKTNGAAIRQQLIRWRDNDAQFQPMIQHSFLLTELAPLSQQLSALAAAGLDALDGNHPETQQAIVDQAKKPQAQLLLVIAPAIQKLINKN